MQPGGPEGLPVWVAKPFERQTAMKRTENSLTTIAARVLRVAALLALLALVAWAVGAAEMGAKPEQQAAAGQDAEEEEAELELAPEVEETLKEMRAFWQHKTATKHANPEFPDVGVPSRTEELEFYPCMDCHEDDNINIAKIRPLTDEHENIVLDHGGGRFWCLTCHNLQNMDYFRSMTEERIDFNKPFLLCGQCHAPRQKDWYYGGHGKRIGNWKGEKVSLSCTECHSSHSPSIKPKQPDPPPKMHKGPDGFFANLKKLGFWKTAEASRNE
jgi:nitrate reductase cytochrome c-type subunit